MFIFLSKLLPLLVYPLGLTCILLILALILERHPRYRRLSLILGLLLLWLASTSWVAKSLRRSLEWQYLPPTEMPKAEVIVVLGGGTGPAEYPRQMVEVNGAGDRVIYAARLYQQGIAPHLLLSGGRINWLSTGDSPAQEMADLLKMMAVPDEAVWLETTSQNTYENAVNSHKILAEKGIQRILLVTSAMHMPRSVMLFRQQGFDVIPAPTDYSVTQASWNQLWSANLPAQLLNLLPSADNLASTSASLKEYLGIIVYQLRGSP
jgi:uncharacterized SAM-binding protein YcdF (DUF218 family)